jgi:anti-sigma B factor antagonist
MSELRSGNPLVPSARLEGNALVASIRGDVDLNNSPSLRVALRELISHNSPARVVLNLSQVSYMDSSAIAVLVEILRGQRAKGGTVSLVALQPRVQGLLEIAKLHQVFGVVKTEAEALQNPK